ncbi:MAG: molecular chaperone TorD, partial [Mesorhizobium sp.]
MRLEEATGTSCGADALVPGVRDADVDDVNSARADEYALLATLLLAAPDANLMARLSGLRGDTETPLGLAHAALGQAAASASPAAVSREYFELFIGVGRGELLPYA